MTRASERSMAQPVEVLRPTVYCPATRVAQCVAAMESSATMPTSAVVRT